MDGSLIRIYGTLVPKSMFKVDLNCDMGEGGVHDSALMQYVSSVNIACGAHAGSKEIMLRTIKNARSHGVAIGAHPGYADRENFGRVDVRLSANDVFRLVSEQIMDLKAICESNDAQLKHVKPHGALYNRAAKDRHVAAAIALAIAGIDQNIVLYGLANSVSLVEAKKAGLRAASEAFADRTYQVDGSLTPRTSPNAIIKDASMAAGQALDMVIKRSVVSQSGRPVSIVADTICIHGDGEYALDFAEAIVNRLTTSGVLIEGF